MDTQQSPPLEEVLELAKRAARSAGNLIRGALLSGSQRSDVKNTKSGATDLVTETDQRCEDLVIKLIRETYPDHLIIGEESAGSERYELTDSSTWTIDPIDGTTNFVHRLALSCVIVAFVSRKRVLVGVVYDPMADEMFYATRGGGAFLERADVRTPLRVAETKSVASAVLSMDPGYGRDATAVARYSTAQGVLLRRGLRNVRVVGCTGLNMAWVACGRLDAGFEEGSWEANTGPKIWDFSAGSLLVEEAGGLTRDVGYGTRAGPPGQLPLDLLGRSFFCAATPTLAEEIRESIAEARAAVEGGIDEAAAKRARTT